jgi:anti-sigma factor ChrR (cupin superfamily)
MPGIQINTDFTRRVVVAPPGPDTWIPSPEAGVHRHRLDRSGDEVARATSIVRYDAGSRFAAHTHGGGEEFLVLEGTFSDEFGDYPAGTYVRNPPGSRHAPFSRAGCIIFVKLWQFAPGDGQRVVIDTRDAEWAPGTGPGLETLALHDFEGVSTQLVRAAPHTRFDAHAHPGGEEILVLSGALEDEFGRYPAGTWLRSPCGSRHQPYTGVEGALIFVKSGLLGAELLQLPADA